MLWHPRRPQRPSRIAPPSFVFLARLLTLLEGDAIPLSTYTGVFACLRASLAHKFASITVADRKSLKGTLERRFTSFSDPTVVLAFYLDPFWVLVRARLSCLLWGGQSQTALRDAAVNRLCASDVAIKAALLPDLASFAALEVRHAGCPATRSLHQVLWLRLWGATLRVLQPLAVRLLSTPPSAAGGERVFKTLKGVLSTRRKRLASHRVDAQTRLTFNAHQMRRPCPMAAYRRSQAEVLSLAMLEGEVGTGAPEADPVVLLADEGAAALDGGDSSDGDDNEKISTARLSEEAPLERLLGSGGLQAAVRFLME